MNKIKYFILFILSILEINAQIYAPEKLDFSVNLEKTVYLLDEPILVEFRVENNSEDTVLVPRDISIVVGNIKYFLIDSSNNKIQAKASIHGDREPLGYYLLPNEKIIEIHDIRSYVHNGIKLGKYQQNRILEGDYYIDATYNLISSKAWCNWQILKTLGYKVLKDDFPLLNRKYLRFERNETDKLQAKSKIFKVLSPSSNMKSDHDKYMELVDALNSIPNLSDRGSWYNSLHYRRKINGKFVSENFNSKYLSNVLLSEVDRDTLHRYRKNILDKYKNSMVSFSLVEWKWCYFLPEKIWPKLNKTNQSEYRQYAYEYFTKNYPNTKLAEYAHWHLIMEKEVNARSKNFRITFDDDWEYDFRDVTTKLPALEEFDEMFPVKK